jgi:predicted phage-related endonuclease
MKSTNDRQAKLWDDDQVPDAAELQCQHCLAVTGRSHAWVAVLVNGRDPMLRRVERDEHLIEVLTEMEREFWETYVLPGNEPPIDDSEATEKALAARYPIDVTDDAAVDESVTSLLDAWELAKADEKAAKDRARHAQSRIVALVGDAGHASVHGERVLSLVANGTFSAKRFTTENPELAETFTVTKPGVDTARLKAEHPDLYRRYCARVLRRATTNGASDG